MSKLAANSIALSEDLPMDVPEALQDENGNYEEEMFGDKSIRWYQTAAKNGVEQGLEDGAMRILVELPTGAGKTITSGLIFGSDRVRRALKIKGNRPLRLLFIAHKNRLLTQAERAYADASNIELILHSAFQPIPDDLDWDITCIDEAHHEAMMSIQLQLDSIGDKPIIGLTATPDRADGCLIKFELIIAPISRQEAVDQGFLAPTRLHSFVDVPTKNKVPFLKQIFTEYGDQMGQTMVFVRTKKEVREITSFLSDLGYSAVSILDQNDKQTDLVLDRFSSSEIQFIVNCNKINEGVDVAGCTDVVLGRQFGSYPQLNQVIGRAARPDSDCNVWELVNPLSGANLDTTVVVGTPELHRLIYTRGGEWCEREFDYTSVANEMGSAMSMGGSY
jgi:superfamily II DNA or RNA helicase